LGALKESDAFAAYREQASYLHAGGVDGFIIETIFQLKEALLALRACREVSSLPVIVSLTFSSLKRGGVTLMGDRAFDAAAEIKKAGGNAAGANCGDLNPREMAEIVKSMLPAGLPVCVQPNAGKPRFEEGKTFYDLMPADFAADMMTCLDNGASIVGGCCGTTPAHIKALRELLPPE
jgi:5-methyltetrahydrofolate--homocysteine methyltransferase